MSRRLINIPGTLQSFTAGRDDQGKATKTPGPVVKIKCRIDALGASGTLLGGTAEEQSRWRALIVSTEPPEQDQKLTSRGAIYDLVGTPWSVTDKRGNHDHYEANVRKR